MNVQGGKYHGRSVESLLLKEGQYIGWLLSASINGPLLNVKREAQRRIEALDWRPFACRCSRTGCDRPATRLSFYVGNQVAIGWCDECNPCSFGATADKLVVLRTYREVLHYVLVHCGGSKSAFLRALRSLARAKGLPDRPKVADVVALFADKGTGHEEILDDRAARGLESRKTAALGRSQEAAL